MLSKSKILTLVIALVPLAHALPQPQHDMSGHDMANSTEHDMSGHDMGNATSTEHDMSEHGHDMEGGVDISQRPPFACAHLEVYHWDGAGSVGYENMGRELEKSMQSQLNNVTTLGVFYNSFDSDFNRTALASAETAAAVLKGKIGLCPETKFALSGYSLGAMVLHAIQLEPEVQEKVVAVVTYGDPILDEAFHQNRLELPINNQDCIIRMCNTGDYFCDAQGREAGTVDPNNWVPHWDYVRDGTAMKAAEAITKCYKDSGPTPEDDAAEPERVVEADSSAGKLGYSVLAIGLMAFAHLL